MRFDLQSLRDQKTRADGEAAARRAFRRRLCALEIAQHAGNFRVGKIEASAICFGNRQPAQIRKRFFRIVGVSGVDLSANQKQTVVDVVGKKLPQSVVAFHGLRRFCQKLVGAAFDQQAVFLRRIRRESQSLPRLILGLGIVA